MEQVSTRCLNLLRQQDGRDRCTSVRTKRLSQRRPLASVGEADFEGRPGGDERQGVARRVELGETYDTVEISTPAELIEWSTDHSGIAESDEHLLKCTGAHRLQDRAQADNLPRCRAAARSPRRAAWMPLAHYLPSPLDAFRRRSGTRPPQEVVRKAPPIPFKSPRSRSLHHRSSASSPDIRGK